MFHRPQRFLVPSSLLLNTLPECESIIGCLLAGLKVLWASLSLKHFENADTLCRLDVFPVVADVLLEQVCVFLGTLRMVEEHESQILACGRGQCSLQLLHPRTHRCRLEPSVVHQGGWEGQLQTNRCQGDVSQQRLVEERVGVVTLLHQVLNSVLPKLVTTSFGGSVSSEQVQFDVLVLDALEVMEDQLSSQFPEMVVLVSQGSEQLDKRNH